MARIDELSQRSVATPRPSKPSDEVLNTAERLNNRLSGLLSNLADLRERVSGSRPPEEESRGDVATSFAIGGFVGSAGQALERAHVLIGECEDALTNIIDVI